MALFHYLEDVRDRRSFVEFVRALAAEREKAEEMERADPVRYQLGGALDWQNGNISGFLWAALAEVENDPEDGLEPEPSWKLFAEFLYMEKIYE
jgi:hypothetical protein